MEASFEQKIETFKSTTKTLPVTPVNKNDKRRVYQRVQIVVPTICEICEEIAAIKICAKDGKEIESSITEKQGTPLLKEETPSENRIPSSENKGVISQKGENDKLSTATLPANGSSMDLQILKKSKASPILPTIKEEEKVEFTTTQKTGTQLTREGKDSNKRNLGTYNKEVISQKLESAKSTTATLPVTGSSPERQMPKTPKAVKRLSPIYEEDEEEFATPSIQKTGIPRRHTYPIPKSARTFFTAEKRAASLSTQKTSIPSIRQRKSLGDETPPKDKGVISQQFENDNPPPKDKGLTSQKFEKDDPILIDGTPKRQINKSPKAVRKQFVNDDERQDILSTPKKPKPVRKLFPIDEEDEEEIASPNTQERGAPRRQTYKTPKAARKLFTIDEEDEEQAASPSTQKKSTPSTRQRRSPENNTPLKDKGLTSQKFEKDDPILIDGTPKRQIYKSPKAVRKQFVNDDERQDVFSTPKKPKPVRKLFPIVEEDEEEIASPRQQIHKTPKAARKLFTIDEEDEVEIASPNTQETGAPRRQAYKTPKAARKLFTIDEEDEEQAASPSTQKKSTPSTRQRRSPENKAPPKDKGLTSQNFENDNPTLKMIDGTPKRQIYKSPKALRKQLVDEDERQDIFSTPKKPKPVRKLFPIDEEDEEEIASPRQQIYKTPKAARKLFTIDEEDEESAAPPSTQKKSTPSTRQRRSPDNNTPPKDKGLTSQKFENDDPTLIGGTPKRQIYKSPKSVRKQLVDEDERQDIFSTPKKPKPVRKFFPIVEVDEEEIASPRQQIYKTPKAARKLFTIDEEDEEQAASPSTQKKSTPSTRGRRSPKNKTPPKDKGIISQNFENDNPILRMIEHTPKRQIYKSPKAVRKQLVDEDERQDIFSTPRKPKPVRKLFPIDEEDEEEIASPRQQIYKTPKAARKLFPIDEEDEEEIASPSSQKTGYSTERQGHKTPETVREQSLDEAGLLTPHKPVRELFAYDEKEIAPLRTHIIEKGNNSEYTKQIKNNNEIINQKFQDNKLVNSNFPNRPLYKKVKDVRKLPNVLPVVPKGTLPPMQEVESFNKMAKAVVKDIHGDVHGDVSLKSRTGSETAAAKKQATKLKETETIIRKKVGSKQPKLDKSALKEGRRSFLGMHVEENKTDENLMAKFNKRKFFNEFLERHNKYRGLHGVPPLKLNENLMDVAAMRALYLAKHQITKIDVIDHGENVQLINGNIPISAKEIVKSWYQQINDYNFDESKPVAGKITDGFTQMIWKETLELGVGIAREGDITWISALYDPPGNFADEFQRNVPINEKAIFIKQCLEAHNKYRQLHGCPPLKLDTTLCNSAHKWAKTVAKHQSLKDPENIPYGVNMFHGEFNHILTGEEVVEKWYNEAEKYNFDAGMYSIETQHFAQIIWRDTRDLGVGYIRIGMNTFVVCYYDPAGNSAGEFLNNVYRIGGRPPQVEALKKLPFEEEILAAHNKYRSMHGCRPLVLNRKLCADASHMAYLSFLETKNYAQYLFTRCFAKKKPNGLNQFHGKNVQNISADYVVKTWYDEKYAVPSECGDKNIAPFAQVIWASAKAMGVGIASNQAIREVWIFCCYDNKGKVSEEEYQNNVPAFGSPPDNYNV